jgi:Sec-independent protein translocase protein TatA
MLAFITSAWGWTFVLLLACVLFSSRVPHVGRSLGQTLTAIRRGLRGGVDDDEAGHSS